MKNLLICIPTHNRREILNKQLNNLVKIDPGFFDIVVFDNASTDGTDIVLKELMHKHKFIKYKRNIKNLGYNGNIIEIVKYAKTHYRDYKYLYILSDDDIVFVNNFRKILKEISNKKDLVLVQWLYTDIYGVVKIRPQIKGIDFNNLFTLINQTLLISSYIYPMEFIKEYNIEEFIKFSDNTFLHAKLIVDCIKKTNNIEFISIPIGYEIINFEWRFDLYKTFCIDRYEATIYIDKVLGYNASKKTATNTTDFLLFRFIIWHILNINVYDKYLKDIIIWKFKNFFITKKTILFIFLIYLSKVNFIKKLFFNKLKNRVLNGIKAQKIMINLLTK